MNNYMPNPPRWTKPISPEDNILTTAPTATGTVYSPIAKAEAVAAELAAGDPDWTYTVIPNPSGANNAKVAIYDEDGEFVSIF